MGKLLTGGLVNLDLHEKVQILFDDILAPKMEVDTHGEFSRVVKRLWIESEGANDNEKYQNALDTALEQKTEAQRTRATLEAEDDEDKAPLYEAQYQLAKARIMYDAINMQLDWMTG